MSAPGPVGLLVNPTAGRGSGFAAGARVRAELRRLGHEVTDLSGPDLDAARRAARRAARQEQALVVVGGDGLVHAAVQEVAGTGTALGIVPAGTGNDIARGLGLPLGDPAVSVAALSAALREGRHRDVDAIHLRTAEGERWCASIVASGVDALVNERANAWRWPPGPARYTLAALRELALVRGVGLRIELDGRELRRRVLLAAVANTSCYGGGLRMAPDADPADGLLDVVVVDELPPLAALRLFTRLRAGEHLRSPAVQVHRARRVRLEPLDEEPGTRRVARAQRLPHPHADGEPVGTLPLTCEAVPAALRVLA
ncbi:diacylglycerol/lipid kinase family protein [Kineococcus sp. SYSU DK018]|uniref:diacylglycerol/lipid kinase family protein n=1 Tax=Kineococcus sp. SYSU DK018 TaxID=3383139 RepID=UPI003D7DB582